MTLETPEVLIIPKLDTQSCTINNKTHLTTNCLAMSSVKFVMRSLRPSMVFKRPISSTAYRFGSPGNAKPHEGTVDHRKIQTEKPLNPHMTNTNSTVANEM